MGGVTRAAVVTPILALAAFVGLHGAPVKTGSLAGFAPMSFAAVGDDDVWVLGTFPCRTGSCAALVRTTDAGRRFTRVAVPFGAVAVRFADSRDGFAYGASSFWTTHDGGSIWRRLALRQVLAFATGGGTAYAVTGRCGSNGCASVRFERSPVTADAWRSTAMPFAHAAPNFDLAAVGTSVWLFGGASSGGRLSDVLARSSDSGRTFVTGTAPCYAELAAHLEPSSARVLWAFCPTGMMGIAWRSTDAGARFTALHIPRCCPNSTSLAPASDETAVAAANGVRRLLRTRDGGSTWLPAGVPRGVTYWSSIEFADARVGLGLAQIGGGLKLTLLRTSDSGATWRTVPIR